MDFVDMGDMGDMDMDDMDMDDVDNMDMAHMDHDEHYWLFVGGHQRTPACMAIPTLIFCTLILTSMASFIHPLLGLIVFVFCCLYSHRVINTEYSSLNPPPNRKRKVKRKNDLV